MYKKDFDIAKIKRFLARYGKEFTFQRVVKDEYKEDSQTKITYKAKGVFHETSSYVTSNIQNGTESRSKPQPMILVEATKNLNIQKGDTIQYCNTDYEVIQILNINDLDVAFDVSLRVIDDGTGFGC